MSDNLKFYAVRGQDREIPGSMNCPKPGSKHED